MILVDGPVDRATFEAGTGWAITPRCSCKAELCVPLPPDAATEDGVDVDAVAGRLGMPVVRDEAHDLVAVGPETSVTGRGRDLQPAGEQLGFAQVAEAVDAICPAIEIVDDRRADYRNLEVLSVIADNSWNAGIVLGDFVRSWPELESIEGIVAMDGTITDRGFGRDVLGHPFHPVAWLATHLARIGTPLRAGDIVMTGNLVTTKFPEPPCAYRFDLIGLGSVEVSINV